VTGLLQQMYSILFCQELPHCDEKAPALVPWLPKLQQLFVIANKPLIL